MSQTVDHPYVQPIEARLSRLLWLALPIVLTQLVGTAMQFTDAYLIHWLGPEPLAAILPAGLVYYVFLSIGFGVITTLNTFVSQSEGRGDRALSGVYAWQAIWFSILYGLLLLPIAARGEALFALLGSDPILQKMEAEYFQISVYGAIPTLIAISLAGFFVGTQRAVIPMIAVFLTLILNAALAWIFIYGHFGFPKMGLAGAAVGTALAAVFHSIFLMAIFLSGRMQRIYGTHRCGWRFHELWDLMKVGVPSGVQSFIEIFAWGILIWLVGRFGMVHLAATTIIVRYMQISLLPAIGLGGALTSQVGAAIGAGKLQVANRLTLLGLGVAVVYMGGLGVALVLLREPLFNVFTNDPAIIFIGKRLIFVVALFQFINAVSIIYCSALRGAGDTVWVAKITLLLCSTVFFGIGFWITQSCTTLRSFGPWTVATLYAACLGGAFAWRWHHGPWRGIDIFSSRKNIVVETGPPAA